MERFNSYLAAEAIRAYVDLTNGKSRKSSRRSRKLTPAISPARKRFGQPSNGGGAVRIKWPRRAEKNLEQEAEYIAPEDPEAVLGWFNVLSTASKN